MSKSIKITAGSELLPLADLITMSIRRGQGVSLQAAGSTDVHLAVHAIAVARDYLAFDGIELGFVSTFVDPDKGTDSTPAMLLHVDRPERLFSSAPEDTLPADSTNK